MVALILLVTVNPARAHVCLLGSAAHSVFDPMAFWPYRHVAATSPPQPSVRCAAARLQQPSGLGECSTN